jgi:hypothetical protein
LTKGRQEGEILILERLLERKFGPLTEAQCLRLEAADADTLLMWSKRMLTVGSVDEVLR